MTYSHIELAMDGAVAIMALARPEVLNAISPATLAEIRAALDAIEDPASGIRCLVITGKGRAFCSGADISGEDVRNEGKPNYDAGTQLEQHYHPTFRRFRNLKLPVITAVNGPAAGVGMSLALSGDLIYAAEQAYFVQGFTRIGLVPDGGSTWLLPRLIGLARARALSLAGDKVTAAQAVDWGLINYLTPNDKLMEEALAQARKLADGPPIALGLTRRLYWESPHNSYEQQLDLERQFQRIAGGTADHMEGIDAFLEKRPPRFTGR